MKTGRRKVAFRLGKAGKVETQNRNPGPRQTFGDLSGGGDILGTGETMRKQSRAPKRAKRQVQPASKRLAGFVFKLYRCEMGHSGLPFRCCPVAGTA